MAKENNNVGPITIVSGGSKIVHLHTYGKRGSTLNTEELGEAQDEDMDHRVSQIEASLQAQIKRNKSDSQAQFDALMARLESMKSVLVENKSQQQSGSPPRGDFPDAVSGRSMPAEQALLISKRRNPPRGDQQPANQPTTPGPVNSTTGESSTIPSASGQRSSSAPLPQSSASANPAGNELSNDPTRTFSANNPGDEDDAEASGQPASSHHRDEQEQADYVLVNNDQGAVANAVDEVNERSYEQRVRSLDDVIADEQQASSLERFNDFNEQQPRFVGGRRPSSY
ncbi:MAG: hypothetical protein Q9166_006729 [cf. Caloplaca sp. 2 TL-2023]